MIHVKTRYRLFAMAMAAALAVTAAGCAGNESSAADEEEIEVVTVYVTDVDPAAGSEALGADASSSSEEASTSEPMEGSMAGTASTAAAEDFPEAGSSAAVTAAEADTAAAADTEAMTTAAASVTAEDATAADTSDLADTAEDAAADRTSVFFFEADTGTTSAPADLEEEPYDGWTGSTAAAAYYEDGADSYDPSAEREEPDTELKESVLAEALHECTGWGQSAGSSLRAAYAATQLLSWANQAGAADVDPALLEGTVNAEFRRLSREEQAVVRSNWSSVSYDASMILDDFDEISYLLEDAGCSETAREAAKAKNALKNWKAAEKALNTVLK
ncbi:MAG: hypothetical protein Q4F43_06535 [Eubacteriales bacterium]|nr:hypothetical protein [Eubacteriales bacterium]